MGDHDDGVERFTDRPSVRVGIVVWAALGTVGLVGVAWLLATRLAVVTVPLLLALFPAALLSPAVGWLHRHRWPRAFATVVVVVAASGLVAGVLALVVPAVAAQVPALADNLTQGGSRLDALVQQVPGTDPGTSLGGLVQQGVLSVLGGLNAALLTALDLMLGLVLIVVLVFCYLSGGARIPATALSLLPPDRREPARDLLDRLWETLGTYVRALSAVALFDAAFAGLGLWLLGVPLVLPVAVLVFFGAFVPYIGAFLSGLAAVLVAFSAGGLGQAVAVLVLIVIVQQVDGNVVQPLVMGRVIRLSAFSVIVAVSAGAALLGVLGAFIAVPAAACTARAVAFARDHQQLPPRPAAPDCAG